MAECMAFLASHGHFAGMSSILEFGPQTIGSPTNDVRFYERFARRIGGERAAQAFAADAYDPEARLRKDAQKAFYRLFGLTDYASVDLIDPGATYRHNLNEPLKLDRSYDIVTDFGTSEHIFNIGQSAVNAHNALRPGGIYLSCLPILGQNYHGFYNIHNVWHRSLAEANGYNIIMFLHTTDCHATAVACERVGRLTKFQDIRTREPHWMTLSFYIADVLSILLRKERVSSMIWAALRKVSDAPFVFPQQINKYWVGSRPSK